MERAALDDVWRDIKQQVAFAKGAPALLILAAMDVDAVCACKTLTTLLQSHDIGHLTVPVRSFSDANVQLKSVLTSTPSVTGIVLLNCGGSHCLADELYLTDTIQTVYLFDANWPLCLENVYPVNEDEKKNDRIAVYGVSVSNFPDEKVWYNYVEEQQNVDMDCGGKNQEGKKANSSIIADYYCSDGDLHSNYKAVRYPCAHMMLHLAQQIDHQQVTRDVLWNAIVGTTHYFLNDRCEWKQYDVLMSEYRDYEKVLHGHEVEPLPGKDQEEKLWPVRPSTVGQISSELQTRLVLFRHIPLWDALAASPFLLRLSPQTLELLLAKVGIPKQDAQHSTFPNFTAKLKTYLESSRCTIHTLDHIFVWSFTRRRTSTINTDASDVAYVLNHELWSTGDAPSAFWKAFDLLTEEKIQSETSNWQIAMKQTAKEFHMMCGIARDLTRHLNGYYLTTRSSLRIRCYQLSVPSAWCEYHCVNVSRMLLQTERSLQLAYQEKNKGKAVQSTQIVLYCQKPENEYDVVWQGDYPVYLESTRGSFMDNKLNNKPLAQFALVHRDMGLRQGDAVTAEDYRTSSFVRECTITTRLKLVEKTQIEQFLKTV